MTSKGSSNKAEDLASWEKHTKGIGSKLLAKFGFKGRLGANETGISTAIEVTVRPTNAGLGFGDVDAPKNKANSAEKGDTHKTATKKKKLSEAELLADSQGWKRTKYAKVTEESAHKRTTESFLQDYEKLISSSKDVSSIGKIIDMRFAEAKVITDLNDISTTEIEEDIIITEKPKLGQELLYNLTSIVEKQKMKVAADSRRLLDEQQIRQRYDEDMKNIQLKKEADQRRIERLKSFSSILMEIEKVANQVLESQENIDVHTQLSNISKLVQEVYDLSPEEFALLGVGKVLPGILSKILSTQKEVFLDNIHPLKLIHATWQELIIYFEQKGLRSIASECSIAFQRTIEKEFLPLVRRFISNWDVVRDGDRCVAVFEGMKLMLPFQAFEETVDVLLMPKITQAVQAWNKDVKHPFHTWLLPWVPLLSSKLSSVYPEVRRKLVDYLRTWHAIDSSPVKHLAPWVPIFDRNSLENLLSKAIIPKLVDLMRRELVIDPGNQSLDIVDSILAWKDVLPAQHMTCILAGEFFPKWLRVLMAWLNLPSPDFQEIAMWYQGWKTVFPKYILEDRNTILPILDFALEIMKESAWRYLQGQPQISSKKFEAIIQTIESNDYYVLIKKVLIDSKFREKVEQAHVSAASTSNATSMKDILEILAEKHNVEFIPKFGRTVEGKPAWQFGKSICYIEHNVVFVPKKSSSVSSSASDWTPISLEDLVASAV